MEMLFIVLFIIFCIYHIIDNHYKLIKQNKEIDNLYNHIGDLQEEIDYIKDSSGL